VCLGNLELVEVAELDGTAGAELLVRRAAPGDEAQRVWILGDSRVGVESEDWSSWADPVPPGLPEASSPPTDLAGLGREHHWELAERLAQLGQLRSAIEELEVLAVSTTGALHETIRRRQADFALAGDDHAAAAHLLRSGGDALPPALQALMGQLSDPAVVLEDHPVQTLTGAGREVRLPLQRRGDRLGLEVELDLEYLEWGADLTIGLVPAGAEDFGDGGLLLGLSAQGGGGHVQRRVICEASDGAGYQSASVVRAEDALATATEPGLILRVVADPAFGLACAVDDGTVHTYLDSSLEGRRLDLPESLELLVQARGERWDRLLAEARLTAVHTLGAAATGPGAGGSQGRQTPIPAPRTSSPEPLHTQVPREVLVGQPGLLEAVRLREPHRGAEARLELRALWFDSWLRAHPNNGDCEGAMASAERGRELRDDVEDEWAARVLLVDLACVLDEGTRWQRLREALALLEEGEHRALRAAILLEAALQVLDGAEPPDSWPGPRGALDLAEAALGQAEFPELVATTLVRRLGPDWGVAEDPWVEVLQPYWPGF